MAIKRLDHVNFVTHNMNATSHFYCEILGLIHGKPIASSEIGMEYFYIEGDEHPVLHIADAKTPKKQAKFHRLAEANLNGIFATGALDHYCLLMDYSDYQEIIEKLWQEQWLFETYVHEDIHLKQIWVIDPNGIRVELNFL